MKEQKNMILNVFIKYWCIHYDHKCKQEDIALRMMKFVLVIV